MCLKRMEDTVAYVLGSAFNCTTLHSVQLFETREHYGEEETKPKCGKLRSGRALLVEERNYSTSAVIC